MIFTFLIGILLNFFSLNLIIFANSKRLKPVHLLILNLLISNMVYLFGLPLFVLNTFNHSWPLGKLGCQCFFFFDFIGMTVTVYTGQFYYSILILVRLINAKYLTSKLVTALSVERCVEVTDKKKRLEKFSDKFKLLIASLYLVMIWLGAISFSQSFIHSIKIVKFAEEVETCDTTWTETKLNIFFAFKFLINFILPFSVILVSSAKLIICLREFSQMRKRFLIEMTHSEKYGTFSQPRHKTYIKGRFISFQLFHF